MWALVTYCSMNGLVRVHQSKKRLCFIMHIHNNALVLTLVLNVYDITSILRVSGVPVQLSASVFTTTHFAWKWNICMCVGALRSAAQTSPVVTAGGGVIPKANRGTCSREASHWLYWWHLRWPSKATPSIYPATHTHYHIISQQFPREACAPPD